MRVVVHPDPAAVANAAAAAVAQLLGSVPDAVIALSTGSTPEPLYRVLLDRAAAGEVDLGAARWVQLDEWMGLSRGDPGSCSGWLDAHFLVPAGIAPGQVLRIDPQAPDWAGEADRVAGDLAELGGLDLAILGIGRNGHLGLNEPADGLTGGVHVVELAKSSREHPMLGAARPTHGITLGMADLLAARHGVLALATGGTKAAIVHQARTGAITTALPASLLRLVAGAVLHLDRAAAESTTWRTEPI